MAVTATYDLFKLKMLPALLECFVDTLGIAKYWAADRVIELRKPSARIILRSAESGGGLESTTAKGAWLDEAGQDAFTLSTWEAVLRRLSINLGRALLTTTIYNMGWLKSAVYDRWTAHDPDYDVIQFDSTENPTFPQEEYERARRDMPRWKFNMFYRGMFERPAGLIYDSFDEKMHKVPRFAIPDHWERYMGLDFGGVNTAALFYAKDPGADKYYLYREYKAGGRTAEAHTEHLLKGEPSTPTCVGGSKPEGQWRVEFRRAGLPVREPDVKEVEIGIQRVYGAHARGQIYVFEDCAGYLDEKLRYSRKLDDEGEPTEEIDDKNTFHRMDAERYIMSLLMRQSGGGA